MSAAELPKLTCEVCGEEEAVGVASVPGVPISVAYGPKCLEANAHPWGILVANTAILGGLEHTAAWWQHMVKCTCTHLGRTLDEFNDEVADSVAEMEQEEQHG